MTVEERAIELYDILGINDLPEGEDPIGDSIRQAIAEEREACAKIAEGLAPTDASDSRHRGGTEAAARIAAAIRAQGSK